MYVCMYVSMYVCVENTCIEISSKEPRLEFTTRSLNNNIV